MILVSILVGTALAERIIIFEKIYDVSEEYYYQALTDVKDYRLTFPDNIQSIQLTQNDLGNFADIGVSGQGIGINIQMQYLADPTSKTFSSIVTKGDYRDSKMTSALTKTWSFDAKNPTGATKIHTELKLHYGFFSPLTFVGDDSIKFGMEQALDKIGKRAKVLQQNSGNSQIVSTPPVQTASTQTTPKPITCTANQELINGNCIDNEPVLQKQILAPFVDTTKDPQYYIDRYNKEPEYKKWFDTNYPQYSSIYEAVGITQTRTIPQPPESSTSKPVSDSIIVTTDKTSYEDGDTILVTGEVRELSGYLVNLRVIAPNGNLVSVAQIDVGSDKKFNAELTAGGALMKSEGTYTIAVLYGTESQTAETTFTFSGSTGTPVEGTDFMVSYKITGGKLVSITPDVEAHSLIIAITASQDGSLEITLPRALIDAKMGDQDDTFFVLIDTKQVDFEETATSADRTLTIHFPVGSKKIEIIGTFVLS